MAFPSFNNEHVSCRERLSCTASRLSQGHSGLGPGSFPCKEVRALAACAELSSPGVSLFWAWCSLCCSSIMWPLPCPWEGRARPSDGLQVRAVGSGGPAVTSEAGLAVPSQSVVHVFLGNPNTANPGVGWHPGCCSWRNMLSSSLLSSNSGTPPRRWEGVLLAPRVLYKNRTKNWEELNEIETAPVVGMEKSDLICIEQVETAG